MARRPRHGVRRARALGLAASLVLTVILAVGFARGGGVRTATVVCASRTVDVAFNPAREVVVTSGGARLGYASFTERWVSRACRRVSEPRAYVGKLGAEIRRVLNLHCAAAESIRIHVNPIRDEHGKLIGSSFQVGLGDPLRVIASAILKNRGDPYASRIYRDRRYCRLA